MPEGNNGQQKISKCFTKMKKSRKNPVVILSKNEQRFATKMSQNNNDSIMSTPSTMKSRKSERKSAAVQASVQTDSFAKRDELTEQKAGIKMLNNVDECCRGSILKKISAIVPKEDSDALTPYSIPTVDCNGQSKGSRRNRKRLNKRATMSLLLTSVELN
ncbi:uncharacterized protein LOC112688197 [Sipha flava]|nr:uncharacterized protein LOC112688197 [Sipha flava]